MENILSQFVELTCHEEQPRTQWNVDMTPACAGCWAAPSGGELNVNISKRSTISNLIWKIYMHLQNLCSPLICVSIE